MLFVCNKWAIRSIEGELSKFAAGTFTEDLYKTLKADYILANPPFNTWDQEVYHL